MAKLIIGCGYVGFRVAMRWLERGERVFALTRKPARAEELKKIGISPVIGDVAEPLTFPTIEDLDTVLYAVGFDRSSEYSIEDIYVDGLARALAALPNRVERLIYLSSTGVYGQTGGEWVDEDSACQPERAGGRAVLAAEHLIAEHRLGEQAIILRLAGIYGPDRVPKLDDVRHGRPLSSSGESYLNLIHVDDVVAAVLAAEKLDDLPARYVIGDGCPVRRADFYGEVARQLGVEPPQFVKPHPGAAASPRELSSKRVRNSRMVAELLPTLGYPSYREGLADVIGAEA